MNTNPSGIAEGVLNDLDVKLYNHHAFIKNGFIYPLTNDERKNIQVKIKLLKPKKSWDKRGNIPEVVGKATIYLDGEKNWHTHYFLWGS